MRRSKFSLSNTKLLSCDMGELVPIGLFEVIPGDTVQQNTSCLIRAAPLLAPVMHKVNVRIHHWYVPYRIIWEDFEDFITGGPDGMDSTAHPTRTFAGVQGIGTLLDYLGLPPSTTLTCSMLPFRAYALIWNEWYRDQDLQTELTVNTGNGNDTTTNVDLQNVAWEKDYFTSARPWEQKGPAITIPIGDTAPVDRVSNAAPWNLYTGDSDTLTGTGALNVTAGELGVGDGLSMDPVGGLEADLSSASAVTVGALREAMALQRYEEARARYGSRYVEYLRYLGVRSSDARLQRPEYLGGGRQTIQFSEVLQTAEGTDPVGELRGHGITGLRTNRYRRFFEEHGVVMSMLSIRPKTIYQNGMHRHWIRTTKEDYWQKELQHIGQQEVENREIYAGAADPDGIFGYQDRYDEYRRTESTVAGEFRDTTLNYWHFARDFATEPALNSTFVSCVPTERTFAVPSQDVIYCMANHSIQARRMVSKKATSFIY